MTTILCPTDFSPIANNAMHYAAKMAVEMKADLLLIHAMHVPVVDAYAPATLLGSMMDDTKASTLKKMANLSEEVAGEYGIKVHTHTAFGLASDMVIEIEASKSIDLVVMGTKGAGSAIDSLLGTTSAQVMAKSIKPTLVIPEKANFEGIRRLGYATDLTSETDSEIQHFTTLFEVFKPQITIVHVAHRGGGADRYQNLLRNLGQKEDIVMIEGLNIAEELHAFVRDNGINILALKRHKRNWFEGLFHKSITKQMVFHSDVPVIIFN